MKSLVLKELRMSETGETTVGNDDLLTLMEASKILRVTISTLRAWRCQRRLPFHKIGRKVMLKRRDIRQFIDESVEPRKEDR